MSIFSKQFPTLPTITQWRSSDVFSKDDISVDLHRKMVQEVLPEIRSAISYGMETTSLTRALVPLKVFEDQMTTLREEILHRRGIAILRGFPVDDWSSNEIEAFYWAIGLQLGRPVSQSVMGDRLGHVIDVSGKNTNARAYRNSNELKPHTDPADILMFLCLKPAKFGGDSIFSSAHTVHEIMRKMRPDLLERLYEGYRYHRFGEQPDGFDPITPHRVPVFSEKDGQVSCRLVRQYIEIAADEYPELALSDLDREALEMFEDIAIQDEVGFRFKLTAGEAVIANNYTVLHARTAFEDFSDPKLKRHLLRLWLHADPPRPTVSEIFIYDVNEPGIPPKLHATPFYQNDIKIN